MDAQTRHSLKQNELAEALSKLRSLSDPRLRIALIVIAAAAVLYIGYRWWSSAQAASLAESWQTVSRFDPSGVSTDGPSLDAVREIARRSADSALAAAARLRVATALVVKSRAPAADRDKLLREALDTLKPLTGLSGQHAGFAAAACFMQATIHETLREFDAAGSAYRTLLDDPRFASSPYRGLAEMYSANLDKIGQPVYFEPGNRPEPPPPLMDPGFGTSPTSPIPLPLQPAIQPVFAPESTPPPVTPPPPAPPSETPPATPAAAEPPPATPPADPPPPSTQPATP